jgi:hypothetical protein
MTPRRRSEPAGCAAETGALARIDVALLAEPRVYPGLAAAINSLVRHGFGGTVWVGFRGARPEWAPGEDDRAIEVAACSVRLVQLDIRRSFTFHKPAFLRQVLETLSPTCDAVVYLDTDVVVNRAWTFFAAWLEYGVALVEDVPGHSVGADHPERLAWIEWLESLGLTATRRLGRSFNAGFLGLPRSQAALLERWALIADAAEAATAVRGSAYYLGDAASTAAATALPPRVQAIVEHEFHHDQDALNMALMACDVPISAFGPDGMGFTSTWNVPLAHAAGPVKPWDKRFLEHLLRQGRGPTLADVVWWRYADGPLPALPARDRTRATLALRAARLADRVL